MHSKPTINLKFGWDECCGADRHFKGVIDEVLIYKRALVEDDIKTIATKGLSAVESKNKLSSTWGELKIK